jgi:hypothetical protein
MPLGGRPPQGGGHPEGTSTLSPCHPQSVRAAHCVTPWAAPCWSRICASRRSPRWEATRTAPGRRPTSRATDPTSRPAITRSMMTSACNGASWATNAKAAWVSRRSSTTSAGSGTTGVRRSAASDAKAVRRRVRRRPSSIARRLAVVNTHPRQAISSPRKPTSPCTTVIHVSAATSSSTSPAITRRYRTRAGLTSIQRHSNAASSPPWARARTLANSSPITPAVSVGDRPARSRSVRASAEQPMPPPIGDAAGSGDPQGCGSSANCARSLCPDHHHWTLALRADLRVGPVAVCETSPGGRFDGLDQPGPDRAGAPFSLMTNRHQATRGHKRPPVVVVDPVLRHDRPPGGSAPTTHAFNRARLGETGPGRRSLSRAQSSPEGRRHRGRSQGQRK